MILIDYFLYKCYAISLKGKIHGDIFAILLLTNLLSMNVASVFIVLDFEIWNKKYASLLLLFL